MEKTYVAKGKRGVVSVTEWEGKRVAMKEPNPDADVDTIANEAVMLQRANEADVGPTFIAFREGTLVREFVDGEEILDWMRKASADEIQKMLADVLGQCRRLDAAGISKREMTRPYKHILVADGKPVQIDFERAYETEKPQNVTQACQWLASGRMRAELGEKGIHLQQEQLRTLAKEYKHSYSDDAFRRIVRLVVP